MPSRRSPLSPRPLALSIHLGLAALAAAALPAPGAHAQTAAREYQIAAGPLGVALNRFADAAGVFVVGDAGLTDGRSSAGLNGRYTVAAGFRALLSGSGLEAVARPDGSYALRAVPTGGATLLPTLRIGGTTPAANGSAEQGYRADTVTQVGPWQGRTLQDTPYSMTVIPAELIENLQAATPDQLFRVNPTTRLSRSQHENDQPNVYIRGFSVQFAYRDGVPGDQYNHGASTEDTEQVEILNGLSGFLYGPSNVGGTINYVSKRPTAERLNRLTLGSIGGDSWYAHGDFGGPIDRDGRFGYRVNVAAQDGDTAIDNQRIRKQFFSGAFDWRITDRLLLTLQAVDREYEPDAQANWQFAAGVARPSASRLDADKAWGPRWSDSHYDVTRYGAHLRWEVSDALTLRGAWHENRSNRNTVFSTNVIQANGTYTQTVSNYYGPGDKDMLSRQSDNAGYLFGDVVFDTGAVTHKLTAGVQRKHSRQERYQFSAPGRVFTGLTLDRPTYMPRPVVASVARGELRKNADSRTENVMVGDDITINEQWSVLAGLAYSTIESTVSDYKESDTTPTLSVLYKPLPELTTYISYMEALEQGGVAGEEYRGAPVVNAGEVMGPLLSEQIEIGAKLSVGRMLFTAALFEIDKGLQYYDVGDPMQPKYVQDGRQVHRGLEFTAFGKATDHLTLIGGFTWLDAEVKEQKQDPALEGKRPTLVAEKTAKLRAEYQLPALPALTLVAGASYTGDFYADTMNADKLSSYTVYDLGARYSTAIGKYPLTLRVEANNLTDKAYWVNASRVGDPRTVLFSATAEF